jgi:hypothetical protein
MKLLIEDRNFRSKLKVPRCDLLQRPRVTLGERIMCLCNKFRVVLNWHGSLLCAQENSSQIKFAELDTIKNRRALVQLCVDCGAMYTFINGNRSRLSAEGFGQIRGFDTSSFFIRSADQPNTYDSPIAHIGCQDLILRAFPDGRAELHSGPGLDCDTYRLLDSDEVGFVLSLRQNRWFSSSRKLVIGGDQITVDLRSIIIQDVKYEFKFWKDEDSGVDALILIRDNWKIERLIKYKPLIFYAYYGHSEELLMQLHNSLKTLFEIGNYAGNVCIVGDLNAHQIEWLSKETGGAIESVSSTAFDRLDQVASRLNIPDIFSCDGFQPILYSDCDVVFDGPTYGILTDLLTSERMSAQLEYFSQLERDVSAGSELFAKDGLVVKDLHGFCAGLMGFPGARAMKRVLKFAKFCMEMYVRENGRNSLAYSDQAVLNYVAYKLNAYNSQPLTQYIRTGYPRTINEFKIGDRQGVVHFSGVFAVDKHSAMQKYMENLGSKLQESGEGTLKSLAGGAD